MKQNSLKFMDMQCKHAMDESMMVRAVTWVLGREVQAPKLYQWRPDKRTTSPSNEIRHHTGFFWEKVEWPNSSSRMIALSVHVHKLRGILILTFLILVFQPSQLSTFFNLSFLIWFYFLVKVPSKPVINKDILN